MVEFCLLEGKQSLKLGVLMRGKITTYSGLKYDIFAMSNHYLSCVCAAKYYISGEKWWKGITDEKRPKSEQNSWKWSKLVTASYLFSENAESTGSIPPRRRDQTAKAVKEHTYLRERGGYSRRRFIMQVYSANAEYQSRRRRVKDDRPPRTRGISRKRGGGGSRPG